jgi:hypothetical protein
MADNDLLKKLNDSTSLTDVLIQMEDFMDSLDLYVFKNWINGELVEGPDVKRYWVGIKLRYDYEDMPDPAGGMRLLKHGARVKFQQKSDTVTQPKDKEAADEAALAAKGGATNAEQETEEKKSWIVEIQIPRRFIEELDDGDLDTHSDDVDSEAVSDARDEDIESDDAYQDKDGDGIMDDEEADAHRDSKEDTDDAA